MKNTDNNISRIINNVIMLFIVIIAMILFFLIWNGVKRYDDFIGYQKEISLNSITKSAVEINLHLREKNRLVVLFVNGNLDLINNITKNPDVDSENYKKLRLNIKRFFPGNFTFTITNNKGVPYTTDFDGKIGEICLNDIKTFLDDDVLLTRIHPNNVAYHFDIITRWSAGNNNGLFFVSFYTKNLGRLINLAQLPKHNIMAIDINLQNLIEITKDGSRLNWERNDFRLSEIELSNKINQIEIPNTNWHVVDLVDDDLFNDYLYSIILQNSIMLLFILVVSFMVFYILKHGQSVLLNEEKYKNDFISIVSRELRAPLTSIIGSLDLILGGVAGKVNSKTLDLVEIAKNNGTRLKLLVDDLLDIQSIIYGRMEYKKEPVNIISFINNTVDDVQTEDNRINFQFKDFKELKKSYIFIDKYRLAQVMINLLKNAVRYGKSEVVEVLVQKFNEGIRISVTDHGDGIPEKYQNILFNRFMTIEQHGDQEHIGVGLGLNLVKKIVEAHNGSVKFETTQGIGTTFYVDIPEYIGFISEKNE